jgi:hypothetical protein
MEARRAPPGWWRAIRLLTLSVQPHVVQAPILPPVLGASKPRDMKSRVAAAESKHRIYT